MQTLADRFWSKVRKSDGCWLWTDKPHAPWGYGRLGNAINGKEIKAHRLSWMLHFGPIPDGLGVLHKCDTPLCVRPDHLFLGTQLDNVHDCVAKGRAAGGNGHETHCPAGHPYDAANTYWYRGSRQCRICRTRHRQAQGAREKAARHARGLKIVHRRYSQG